MLTTDLVVGFEEAVDKALSGRPLRERGMLRRLLRRHPGRTMRMAMKQFAEKQQGDPSMPTLDDEDDSDTPILDFWKWLIESGKIQPFLTFLVEEFLPALFQIIITLITAIVAI